MIKQVTIGYHALIRLTLQNDVRIGFPGEGPYVDVAAVAMRGHRVSADPAKDEPGEYVLRSMSPAGESFIRVLMVP